MKQPVITTWFPTCIYSREDFLDEEENENLYKHILKISENIPRGGEDWNSDLYNTHSTYDLKKDSKFNNIINLIKKDVELFSEVFGCKTNYYCNNGWFNIYRKNDYNEKHTHVNSHFSSIYFLKCGENSSPVTFYSPIDEMVTLPNQTYNQYSFDKCKYDCIERSLLIFRSHLIHMVSKNLSDERITLSFNFNVNQREV